MNRLYLVRHGENVANITKEFSHRLVDYSLTEKGVLQAQQTGLVFKRQPVDAIFTSPLKRAVETAALIAEAVGLPYTVLEDLREVNVGDLEGQPPTPETWKQHNGVIAAWFGGELDRCFPGGENGFMLRARFERALQQMLTEREGQDIVAVGHGGIFTFALPQLCPQVELLSLSQLPSQNCSISKIDVQRQNGTWLGELVSWADYSHLSGWAAELVPGYINTK